MDLEFVKTLHFRELDRRNELDQAATYRVAIVGVIAGVFSYYAERIPLANPVHRWLFVVAATGALVFSVLSVVLIIRSFIGYTWKYAPYPSDLLAHYKQLLSYVEQHKVQRSASELFSEQVVERLVQAASANMHNNNVRSELVYRASVFIVFAIACTLIAGVPLISHAFSTILQAR